MLNPAKASETALYNVATSLLGKKKYSAAEPYIFELLKRDGKDAAALFLLSECSEGQENLTQAIAACMHAVINNPSEHLYKEKFIELGGEQRISAYDELTAQVIVECLKSASTLPCARLRRLWESVVMRAPEIHSAYGLINKKNFDPENKTFFAALKNFKPLFNPLFLLGIKNIVAHSAVFEEFITHIRKHLLNDFMGNKNIFTTQETVTLANALSHYSFYTDFILDDSDDEAEKIETIRAGIETKENSYYNAAGISLFACYAPLYTLKNTADIAHDFLKDTVIFDTIESQISDYNALQEIAKSVTPITEIDDETSSQVREQYEQFPYPRWKHFSAESLQRGWKTSGRNEEIEGRFINKKCRILIAGCGTGQQALSYAAIFPQAEILAIDLSRASLAYAIQKSIEFGIENITFKQGDILKLDSLNERFDYVICVGVLHHMKNPMDGLKILTSLLKPDGLMRIGLYSKIARRALLEAQNIIKKSGYKSDAESMRTFRRTCPNLLDTKSLDEVIMHGDYFYMNTYRDLLFHVQEHDLDLFDIEKMLNETALKFISFTLGTAFMDEYAKLYPDDPDKNNLEHWRAIEQEHPLLFKNMYVFWCRKKPS